MIKRPTMGYTERGIMWAFRMSIHLMREATPSCAGFYQMFMLNFKRGAIKLL